MSEAQSTTEHIDNNEKGASQILSSELDTDRVAIALLVLAILLGIGAVAVTPNNSENIDSLITLGRTTAALVLAVLSGLSVAATPIMAMMEDEHC